jgi:hypothetical protein
MTDSASHSGTGSTSVHRTLVLFGQTMGYVAATAGFFALYVPQFFPRIFSRDDR